jgi:hypothetical protein
MRKILGLFCARAPPVFYIFSEISFRSVIRAVIRGLRLINLMGLLPITLVLRVFRRKSIVEMPMDGTLVW